MLRLLYIAPVILYVSLATCLAAIGRSPDAGSVSAVAILHWESPHAFYAFTLKRDGTITLIGTHFGLKAGAYTTKLSAAAFRRVAEQAEECNFMGLSSNYRQSNWKGGYTKFRVITGLEQKAIEVGARSMETAPSGLTELEATIEEVAPRTGWHYLGGLGDGTPAPW